MRSHLKLFLLALLMVVFVIVAAVQSVADPKTRRVWCIVEGYSRLSPTEWVGHSNCGHEWKVVVPCSLAVPASIGKAEGKGAEAWFFNQEEGSWNQLDKVPARGDTLGWIDVPEGK